MPHVVTNQIRDMSKGGLLHDVWAGDQGGKVTESVKVKGHGWLCVSLCGLSSGGREQSRSPAGGVTEAGQ